MIFSQLLRIVLIGKDFISELLTCKVNDASVYIVVAMEIATTSWYSIYFAAKNVLDQKCCDRTLAQSHIVFCPFVSHPWCTSLLAPDLR
jgi:hypothetical protein